MAQYRTPVDIANRALQLCKRPRIVSFSEGSEEAFETGFAYDKVRRAELRRNIWRFATRRAALRPIATTTDILVPGAYASGTTYGNGAIVAYPTGIIWQSTQASNLANTPDAWPTTGIRPWDTYFGPMTISSHDSTVSYYAGELVYISSTAYLSLISANTDTPPTSNWLTLTATLGSSSIIYPITAGPVSQNDTRNVMRLPNGFLREAPQDPKAGAYSYLGAPSGTQYNQWDFEGNYIVSAMQDVVVILRFVADVQDANSFDDMFAEGLAAKLAVAIAPTLAPETKLPMLRSIYKETIEEARLVNGIETGAVQPPEDDLIVCRL